MLCCAPSLFPSLPRAFWTSKYARFFPVASPLPLPLLLLLFLSLPPVAVSSLVTPYTSRGPLGPRAYPLIPLSARTTIRSADVSPFRIASEKIGLAPAPQLLGPAMLQSRELVASSWHGLGRFRVNFIRGPVALLHCVLAWVYVAVPPVIPQDTLCVRI